jgi:hypothetical protein
VLPDCPCTLAEPPAPDVAEADGLLEALPELPLPEVAEVLVVLSPL